MTKIIAATELAFDELIESSKPKCQKGSTVSKDRDTRPGSATFRPSTGSARGRPLPLKAPALAGTVTRSDRRVAKNGARDGLQTA